MAFLPNRPWPVLTPPEQLLLVCCHAHTVAPLVYTLPPSQYEPPPDVPNVKLCWKVPAFAPVLARTAAALNKRYLFMLSSPERERGFGPFRPPISLSLRQERHYGNA